MEKSNNNKRGFLQFIEFLGNLLPHPVILFIIMWASVVVISGITAYFDFSVIDPRPDGTKGKALDGMFRIKNLFGTEGIKFFFSHTVKNFVGFAPLGTVLVSMIGIGIAEKSGLIGTTMKYIVAKAPGSMITSVIVFLGVISNTASELGYVILIPLGAVIYHSLGRHPLAGLATAFGAVSAGYSANVLLGTLDPLLAGITQEAARLISPDYTVGAEVNYYFMSVSTIMITIVGTFISLKIVEPSLGKYNPKEANEKLPDFQIDDVKSNEIKAMIKAYLSAIFAAGLLALLIIPENAILRSSTGSIIGSPFLKGIVPVMLILFSIPGIVYGYASGTFKKSNDVVNAMSAMMGTLSLYIILVFFASQFIAYFKYSNLGPILAVLGSEFIKSLSLSGPLVFVAFILICALINFLIGSSSAQWAATAPIFVPMLMLLGYTPEVIQAAYRIGDSVTNIVTPMMSYFGLIIAMAGRYKKDIGIGTFISMMVPFSIAFLISWVILFYVWVFVLGLPVGPGTELYLTNMGQ